MQFEILVERFKRKDNDKRQASGIFPDESDIDEALHTIIELMDDAEQQFDKENHEKQQKIENDQKRAEKLRVKAMETFGESRKRSEGG